MTVSVPLIIHMRTTGLFLLLHTGMAQLFLLTNHVRNGWGATAIDGLTTAIIMGESSIVTTILEFVPQINFTTTAVENEGISFFETNIRYLGGLISGMSLYQGYTRPPNKLQTHLIHPSI